MNTKNAVGDLPTTKRLALTAFASAALLAAVLMCLPPCLSRRVAGLARIFSEPAQSLSALCARATRGMLGGFPSIEERDSFLQLKTELVNAEAEMADVLENSSMLANENRILRNRLDFISESKALSLTLCQVMTRDPFSEYYDYIVINRGTGDGLKPGCHVLSEKGLVGVVTEAGIGSAKVLLATSRNFSMPCFIRSRNVYGLLTGKGTEPGTQLSMLQPVPQIVVNSLDGILFDNVTAGDQVTVSATGEAGGHGIVVGIVSKVDSSLAGAPVLEIQPAVSFNQLKYVFAVIGKEAVK